MIITWENGVARQRVTAYTNQELSPERIQLLEALGFMWDPLEAAWQEQYHYVQEYRKIHPDTWPQASEEYPVDNNLGSWCANQRTAYTQQKLSPERIQLLEDIGFMWDPLEAAWQEQYNYVQEYRKTHPDRWPQAREEYPVDNNLGKWCARQRTAYTQQKLSPERIQLLEALGFMWDPFESAWQEQYHYLKEYRKIHPDRGLRTVKNIPLVITWVRGVLTQRATYIQQKLSHERIQLLGEIGFM